MAAAALDVDATRARFPDAGAEHFTLVLKCRVIGGDPVIFLNEDRGFLPLCFAAVGMTGLF